MISTSGRVLLLVLTLASLHFQRSACRKRGSRFKIRPSEFQSVPKRVTPGCKLGGRTYDLESIWNPELNPEGIMYCIRCTCVPKVDKNTQIVKGVVQCKHIEKECPKPNCDKPVYLKEACCKVCPGQRTRLDDQIPLGLPDYQGDAVLEKEYSAFMMAGNFDQSVSSKAIGRGYFTIENHDLSFSFLFKRLKSPVTRVRFTDPRGLILHEQPASVDRHGRVCGVWPAMPSIFRRYLHDGKLLALLATERYPRGELRGPIGAHAALKDEIYSSILTSHQKSTGLRGGAVAMISWASKHKRLHISMHHKLMLPMIKQEIYIVLMRSQRPLASTRVWVTGHDGLIEATLTNVNKRLAKQLVNGNTFITVFSTNSSKLARGRVQIKAPCNVFHAVLDGPTRSNYLNAGSATYSLAPTGRLRYRVDSASPRPFAWAVLRKRQRRRHATSPNRVCIMQSHAGSCADMRPSAVELLFRERLVTSARLFDNTQVKGSVVSLPYHSLFGDFTADSPLILTAAGIFLKNAQSTHTAVAWAKFEQRTCALHYQLVRKPAQQSVAVDLVLTGGLWHKADRFVLSRLTGAQARGVTQYTSILRILPALNTGDAILALADATGEYLSGSKIFLPNNCSELARHRPMADEWRDPENSINPKDRFKCSSGRRDYRDGESFPERDSCRSCTCKRGRVECHELVCPVLNCPNPSKVPGECCPVCPAEYDEREACFFDGDKRQHHVGAPFHPYVPPFGFVRCTICECVPGSKAINCTVLRCPKLDCPDELATRAKATDCCKSCPAGYTPAPSTTPPSGQIQLDSRGRSCWAIGREYAHQQQWNPSIAPFGRENGVCCTCYNGRASCRRQTCPSRETCRKLVENKKESCCQFKCLD